MFGFLFRKRGKGNERSRPGNFWISAGEFILVFLGILIALQVENWNQDRQDRKLERIQLYEMLANLYADLEDIEYNIRMQQQYMTIFFYRLSVSTYQYTQESILELIEAIEKELS